MTIQQFSASWLDESWDGDVQAWPTEWGDAGLAAEDAENAMQWLSGIGQGAASGAATGAVAGPWGALIGGLVGAGLGAAQTAVAQQQQAPTRPASPPPAPPPARPSPVRPAPAAAPRPAPAPPRPVPRPGSAPVAAPRTGAPTVGQVASLLTDLAPLLAVLTQQLQAAAPATAAPAGEDVDPWPETVAGEVVETLEVAESREPEAEAEAVEAFEAECWPAEDAWSDGETWSDPTAGEAQGEAESAEPVAP